MDASIAKLAVHPATKPLVVKFADGNTALPTGTASNHLLGLETTPHPDGGALGARGDPSGRAQRAET